MYAPTAVPVSAPTPAPISAPFAALRPDSAPIAAPPAAPATVPIIAPFAVLLSSCSPVNGFVVHDTSKLDTHRTDQPLFQRVISTPPTSEPAEDSGARVTPP